MVKFEKGRLAISKLKLFSFFIPLLLMLKKAFDNREMKSENGFSLAFKLTLLQIEA